MIIDYPYRIDINSKQEAYDTILNLCKNCDRRYDCTGSESQKCNEVNETIKNKFTN